MAVRLCLAEMAAKRNLPLVFAASREDWEAWLDGHHLSSDGVWLKIAKKGSRIDSVRYPDALEVALCHGWIDGQRLGLDDQHFLQRFTPRRPRSKWSKRNRDSATALIESGRMKPAGLRQVEAAKADGRWEAAYDSPRTARVPEDLQRALDENERARQFFSTLDSANRYAILYRIQDAKRLETRARRIEKLVAMLSEHKRIHD
jgi:uncharacterized protein YdeI (YjbR/CyaY-like superfamily)